MRQVCKYTSIHRHVHENISIELKEEKIEKDYYVHTSTVAKYSKKVMIQWINNEIQVCISTSKYKYILYRF